MPATEQTYRNQSLLHTVFAVSGMALLVSTIWMFAADHLREWKQYQRTSRSIDLKFNTWRQASAKEQQLQDHAKLNAALLSASSGSIADGLMKKFKEEVKKDKVVSKVDVSFRRINANVEELNGLKGLAEAAARKRTKSNAAAAKADEAEKASAAAKILAADAKKNASSAEQKAQAQVEAETADKLWQEYQKARKAARDADESASRAEREAAKKHANVLKLLRRIISRAHFREDMAERDLKFTRAKFDKKVADKGLAERDHLEDAAKEIQGEIGQLKKDVARLTLDYQHASDHRKSLKKFVADMTADEDKARKALEENREALETLQTAYRDRRSTYFAPRYPGLGKKILEWPIIDAFGSPLKIETLWDEDNTINYNFVYIRRFDRCTTCHQSMQKTQPDTITDPAYIKEKYFDLILTSPSKEELAELKREKKKVSLTLDDVYGIRIEPWRLFSRNNVVVKLVRSNSRGAKAELASATLSLLPQESDVIRNAGLKPDLAAWEAFASARPGLMMGDAIVEINGDRIDDVADVEQMLMHFIQWGEPVMLRIRRGLPHPFATHPRLDLFVGDASPHPMQGSKIAFGCTVCHAGQGSATAFKWASHTPDNPKDRRRWAKDHKWFDNHHWVYPQHPRRFSESSCLKCHHDVTELEPSERFPDPPAPKVVRGYYLIQKYGCIGCHEVKGYDGPEKRVGPDMRLEPSFYATALQLKKFLPERFAHFTPRHEELSDQLAPLNQDYYKLDAEKAKLNTEKSDLEKNNPQGGKDRIEKIGQRITQIDGEMAALMEKIDPLRVDLAVQSGYLDLLNEARNLATRLSLHPEDDQARRRLRQIIVEDEAQQNAAVVRTLSKDFYRFSDSLKDVETPGTLRKVGPSLRHAARKMDGRFMFDWIRNPLNFRPGNPDPENYRAATRMPRPFGIWDHLDAEKKSLHESQQFEPIEILGIVTYLQSRSQSFDYIDYPEGIDPSTSEEKIASGKMLFQTRGCLACHTHKEFPDVGSYRPKDEIVQGPDLSRIADKLAGAGIQRGGNGRRWLYSWIKNPSRYHARTLMPNLFLDPITISVTDAEGKLKLDENEKLIEKRIDPADDIVEFLLANSSEQWQPKEDTLAAPLNSETRQLAAPLDEKTSSDLRELTLVHLKDTFYVKRAEKYAADGIHDKMPEELKGAEIELLLESDEEQLDDRMRLLYVGRKSIAKYGCTGCHDIPGFEDAKPIGTALSDWGRKDTSKLAFGRITNYLDKHGHGEHDFYRESIDHHQRTGFINQKLREPRSFEYQETLNKKYNERLRMPQFKLSDEDREAIITFVLGLVAEPPEEKFVYHPPPRAKAIQEGQRVLAKFNCRGCHILELDTWKIAYRSGVFSQPQPIVTFPFLKPHFTPDQLEVSKTADRSGLLHATLVGMPALDKDGRPLVIDDEGLPLEDGVAYVPSNLEYPFVLWEPVALDGHAYEVGGAALSLLGTAIVKKYPSRGGVLTKYLLPHVIEMERRSSGLSAGKGGEAMGWLPPPLHAEGKKVNSDWLHEFLLNPYPIRPSVVMRMPKFNMSAREATQLVNYFAARARVDYPYEYSGGNPEEPVRSEPAPRSADVPYEQSMKIVTTLCVKCHIVSDFVPQGSRFAKAPDLSRVDRRLRRDFLRNWIANPKLILPYPTAMPENIPFRPHQAHLGGASQDLYQGTSIEQVEALVNLLIYYDEYAKRRSRIGPLVPKTPPPDAATTGGSN